MKSCSPFCAEFSVLVHCHHFIRQTKYLERQHSLRGLQWIWKEKKALLIVVEKWHDIEDIIWPRGEIKFLFKYWKIFSQYITMFLMKISEDSSKCVRRSDKRFWTFFWKFSEISKDCWRLPNTSKIRRCFNHTPTNFSAVKRTKMFSKMISHIRG